MSLFIGTEQFPPQAPSQEDKRSKEAWQKSPYTEHFRFGLEAEFMLVDAETYHPLWYQDLNFQKLNTLLESIPFDDLPGTVDALEVEPPHKKQMPFVVEGYHIPDANFKMIDVLPKGLEIRTPVTQSIEECLFVYKNLYERLQKALSAKGMLATNLSHHPLYKKFQGIQNKRRYDYWQWAMEVMTTYGPDFNISIPSALSARIDFADFDEKLNFYAPALAALSASSPFLENQVWEVDGQKGKSYRTHKRSIVAPPLEVHPEEGGRLEFKMFEMSPSLETFHGNFLLCLSLLLDFDNELPGRSDRQTRIYDLGEAAKLGLSSPKLQNRVLDVLALGKKILPSYGFAVTPLEKLQERAQAQKTPADDLISLFLQRNSLRDVLENLANLH